MLVFAAVTLGFVLALQRRASGGILGPVLTHVTWSLVMLFALPACSPERRRDSIAPDRRPRSSGCGEVDQVLLGLLVREPDDRALLRTAGGIPAYGNQRSAWDAGARFGYHNPEYR